VTGEAAAAELPQVMPARNPAVEVAEFETELVVFDPRSDQVHLLEGLSAVVFDACDGESPPAALVADLVDVGGVDADQAQVLIARTLVELAVLGLLAGTEYEAPPPCTGCGGAPAARRARRRLRP
jgi:PqqD family protein of HPr-rel-A system